MSRHRAQARTGRLRRWLGLSRAAWSTDDPPASRPHLRLLTPHMDSAPVEPEAGVPFDGRLRPSPVPPEPSPEPLAAPPAPEAPATPEPLLDEGAEHILEAVEKQAAAYRDPFACSCKARS